MISLSLILLGGIVIGFVLVISSAVSVPTAHYGIITRLGKRIGKPLPEGLNFVVPFIDKVLIYSIELKTDPLDEISVFSNDRLDIELKGSVQWRPDKKELKGFVEIPENTILVGLKDAIKSEIGKIAGEKKGDFFIRERKALETHINCIFRLQRPPHYFLNPKESTKGKEQEFGKSFTDWINDKREEVKGISDDEEKKQKQEKIEKIENITNWELPTEREIGDDDELIDSWKLDIISFYKANARSIQSMIDLGENETSPIEDLYHINISIFRLADVDFTEGTKRALERKRQVEAEIVAAKQQQKWKLEIMDELIEKGLDAEKASNAADVMMGISEKRQVISIEGGSVLPLMNITSQKGGR